MNEKCMQAIIISMYSNRNTNRIALKNIVSGVKSITRKLEINVEDDIKELILSAVNILQKNNYLVINIEENEPIYSITKKGEKLFK